ncbi:hypothetical protein GCM10010182_81820 [Actinomadura cremea]|nr:hypothetical protein GCM10010182_81820 [Actinomadura cremea]
MPPLTANLRSTMLAGYGVSRGRGRFVYDPAKDDAILNWPAGADNALHEKIEHAGTEDHRAAVRPRRHTTQSTD